MPFLRLKTNRTISEEQELVLKGLLGDAISLIPGKSEEYLLITMEDECCMWLRGRNDEGIAYLEASIFASEDRQGYVEFTKAATDGLSEILGITPANIYIQFSDIPGWTVNGRYIDRGL